jgi:thioredoxin reductase (NADPH)
MTDVFIIGKGPAGISASLYTARAGLSTTVTGNSAGALGKAEKIENYYGLAEPVSGMELFENGIKGAQRLGVTVLDEEVFNVSYDGNFRIEITR